MAATPAIGVAAFAVDRAGSRTSELQSAPRLRGASVVKPLLFWAGATSGTFEEERVSWEAIARPAITMSDNVATTALWSRVGEERLLTSLNDRTGVAWFTDGEGEHPSLRVMITAGELARAYAAFASDKSDVAIQLRRWMREVPAEQTFGVRRVAGDALEVEEGFVGVKCGWFGGERAHAIVLVEAEQRTVGAAITTSWSADAARRTPFQDAIGNDAKLVAAHDALAGRAIRSATRRALLVAAEL